MFIEFSGLGQTAQAAVNTSTPRRAFTQGADQVLFSKNQGSNANLKAWLPAIQKAHEASAASGAISPLAVLRLFAASTAEAPVSREAVTRQLTEITGKPEAVVRSEITRAMQTLLQTLADPAQTGLHPLLASAGRPQTFHYAPTALGSDLLGSKKIQPILNKLAKQEHEAVKQAIRQRSDAMVAKHQALAAGSAEAKLVNQFQPKPMHSQYGNHPPVLTLDVLRAVVNQEKQTGKPVRIEELLPYFHPTAAPSVLQAFEQDLTDKQLLRHVGNAEAPHAQETKTPKAAVQRISSLEASVTEAGHQLLQNEQIKAL